MKLIILGTGGMGAISLSKIIAQMAMDKNLHVKSTEIHGMAKKGGLVEIHMKIDEDLSPYVPQKEADFTIILDELYLDYGKNLVKNNGIVIALDKSEKHDIINRFRYIHFASSFILGKFVKKQNIFDKNCAMAVLKTFRNPSENIKVFKKGFTFLSK